jgi:hypothetical protein
MAPLPHPQSPHPVKPLMEGRFPIVLRLEFISRQIRYGWRHGWAAGVPVKRRECRTLSYTSKVIGCSEKHEEAAGTHKPFCR